MLEVLLKESKLNCLFLLEGWNDRVYAMKASPFLVSWTAFSTILDADYTILVSNIQQPSYP